LLSFQLSFQLLLFRFAPAGGTAGCHQVNGTSVICFRAVLNTAT
jgi:hypothetical protein